MTLQAGGRLNLDAHGRSLPTTVEVYQLKSVSKVEKLELQPLLDKPQETLGSDWVKTDELVVDPGQSTSQWLARDPQANFMLAVALVRQPAGTSWRDTAALPPLSSENCSGPPRALSGQPHEGDAWLKFYLEGFDIRAQSKADRSNR